MSAEHQIDQAPSPIGRLVVRQEHTLMVNRYTIREVDEAGNEVQTIATAQQKRLALKEKVTFFAGEDRTRPLFGLQARSQADFAATYDVTDADGRPIGWFKKEFRKSLARSTWRMGISGLRLEAVGTERSRTIALARRAWSLGLEDLPAPLRFHFDFHTPDGVLVMSSDRRRTWRDAYDVALPQVQNGTHLDWRLGAAMAVALDALQSR
jgi:hypothetical protein